jgi:hypothetical protein
MSEVREPYVTEALPAPTVPEIDVAAIRLDWTHRDGTIAKDVGALCNALEAERAKVARLEKLVTALEYLPQEASNVSPTSPYWDGRADGYRWAMREVRKVINQ